MCVCLETSLGAEGSVMDLFVFLLNDSVLNTGEITDRGFSFIFPPQETYSVEKYVKHLQDTLDILYKEVKSEVTLASKALGKHNWVFLLSDAVSVIMFQ